MLELQEHVEEKARKNIPGNLKESRIEPRQLPYGNKNFITNT